MRTMRTNGIEETRYNLMIKGFMNKKELMKFIPCGQKRCNDIWKDINSQIKREGLETLDGNVVLTTRVIRYIGKSEQKIVEDYERTKKARK